MRYQDIVEEGYEEDARKRKTGRKKKNTSNADKDTKNMRKSKKELEALRG